MPGGTFPVFPGVPPRTFGPAMMIASTDAAMIAVFTTLFWLLAGLILFTTLAPLSGSAQWWIRGWDFPRVHIAVIAFLVAGLGGWLASSSTVLCGLALLACATYQLSWIYPYTPLARKEVPITSPEDKTSQVSLISVNVLMENEQYERVRHLIDRETPDILLLMEVDETWDAALSEQLAEYDTIVRRPMSNHYGMIFASRLPTASARMVYLSEDNTPAALAEVETPTGRFFFVGLHPQPPVPGTDTEARDEQIKKTARLADRTVLPVVAMGDFNDVAWSHTSARFKAYGGFRDPRVGRGILPSFDATSWIMRFPIDQLYLTEGIDLISFSRLEDIGSDHFPMKAVISLPRQAEHAETH